MNPLVEKEDDGSSITKIKTSRLNSKLRGTATKIFLEGE